MIAVHDTARDHRSRSTWPALIYLLVLEAFGRELAGPRQVLGNHVVIDTEDGAHAVLAHLQRGSVTVTPGQLVHCGEVIARCGNSGNSSEPHVHFQLQDHRWPLVAAGLPFAFTGVDLEGPGDDGIPANEAAMVATPHRAERR